MLLERGRLKSSFGFDEWYDTISQFPGLPIEPMVRDDIREARRLAALADPIDRMIAGTALRLNCATYHRRRARSRLRVWCGLCGKGDPRLQGPNSSSSAFASFRSAVSKPSVNQL